MECFKCLFVNVFLFCFPNICFPLPQTNVGGVRVGEQGDGQHQPDGTEDVPGPPLHLHQHEVPHTRPHLAKCL